MIITDDVLIDHSISKNLGTQDVGVTIRLSVNLHKKNKDKRSGRGQTAVCINRCNVVRELFAQAAKDGRSVTSTDLMALSAGRFKYTDIILVSKELKAAGKITETLKGRQAIWAPVV